MPSYVMAYAYTDFLQYAGPVQTALRETFGWSHGDYWFPEVRSLPGAAAMSTATFKLLSITGPQAREIQLRQPNKSSIPVFYGRGIDPTRLRSRFHTAPAANVILSEAITLR